MESIDEEVLMRISDKANQDDDGTGRVVVTSDDAKIIHRLFYAPPFYVHFPMKPETAWLLLVFVRTPLGRTLNRIMFNRIWALQFGGEPLLLNRRMAISLLSLMDRDVRRAAGDTTVYDDEEDGE